MGTIETHSMSEAEETWWEQRQLTTACMEGDTRTVATLITRDNVNSVVDSRTPLITAIHYHQQEVVEMILEVEGVDVNKAVAGWTALHEASFTNNVVAIQAVIAYGSGMVDTNKIDDDGYTPIMIAIWFDKLEAVKELLGNKDVELDVDGHELEDLARDKNKILFLIQRERVRRDR